jgi:hypothetical protein
MLDWVVLLFKGPQSLILDNKIDLVRWRVPLHGCAYRAADYWSRMKVSGGITAMVILADQGN